MRSLRKGLSIADKSVAGTNDFSINPKMPAIDLTSSETIIDPLRECKYETESEKENEQTSFCIYVLQYDARLH